ncbi:MAG TPA: IS66 family transposase [Bacteroidales bacterium]|nr:IS66 family transposase [Bacteroidales bacterium]
MNADKKRILELEKENGFLRSQIASLNTLVHQLLQEIERLKHPKNSKNSSVPPSKDENRPFKTKSLRASDGKKPGGQTGHEGNTLKMTETPDIVIEHKPQYCNHCGKDITHIEAELITCRQIVDIPPIIPQYTEHRTYRVECSCGHRTETSFPDGINAPISYGANIEAIIAYLHTRQYIPFERMSEYFSDVCNLPISQGTVYDILERFTQKATPAYRLINNEVQSGDVIGSDETGAKVNGKKGWFWTWQNKVATFIAFSSNRGTATINAHFARGFENAVLVHDCWKSHFETKSKTHQICTAHLLRELNYFEERYKSEWATSFKNMLCEALNLKKTLSPTDYYYPINQRTEVEKKLILLLQTPIPIYMKEVCSFQKRISRYKDYLFTFLYYPEVPPDNNASERAIRNIKVKQKISGQFKTIRGAEIYAIIRSVTDTCIKNGQNVLLAFHTIAKLHPE